MKQLTERLRQVADYFERGQLAPEGTTVRECQQIAAWYIDTNQAPKAFIALQEAKRLSGVPREETNP